MRHVAVTLATLSLFSGCGLTSNALDMEDTPMRADNANFDALASAASQVGWQAVRGRSSTDWPLTVYVEKGEKILITQNNAQGNIAFTCDGSRLDDDDRCLVEVNKLWRIAFNAELIDN